ncbi:MAG: trypsin-like peptidase domain-containing protein [Acidimicrobiia bacterium]
MNDDHFPPTEPVRVDATDAAPPTTESPIATAWPVSTSEPVQPEHSGNDSSAPTAGRAPSSGRAALVGALVGAIVGGGVGTGATLLLKDDGNRQVTVTQGSTAVQQVRTGEPAPALTKRSDIHALIAKVEPAVVSINVEVTQDTPFGSQQGKAAGTGFIISSDGVIVTNNHVVETARLVKVQFQDGSSVDAKVLGTDKYNDLGVIKVDKKDLPTLKLGNSSDMRVGDDVVAIGNALALEGGFSVTRGIISGLNRSIQTDADVRLSGLLQTDAAINPGNSGGPLLNAAGEVVGINTAIASPSESQNVGFAIAIDTAKRIISQLEKGTVSNPAYLGVRSSDTADDSGALIGAVEPNSPAEKAGLKAGDVVTEIEGNSVNGASDVVGLVRAHRPGDKIEFKVERDGKGITLHATLGDQPAT